MKLGEVRAVADDKTLEALIAHRYEVMAQYAKAMREACAVELTKLRQQGGESRHAARVEELKLAERWLHRDDQHIPATIRDKIAGALTQSPTLAKLVAMREELRQFWTRTNVSAEQLVADLQAWCKRAEDSGVAALQEMSRRLRAAHA